MHMKIRFNIGIVTAILLMITAMTAATLASVWLVSSRTAEETAGHLFSSVTSTARERFDRLMGEVLVLASLGAAQDVKIEELGNGLDMPLLPLLLTALDENPALYSLYYGFPDGRFLQVISTQGEGPVLTAHEAPVGTRWIVRTISSFNGERDPQTDTYSRVQMWTFLDRSLQPIGDRVEQSPRYDPRKRPWYMGALLEDKPQLSSPYVFSSLQQPGITASKRLNNGLGVFGVDVTLTELSRFVSELDISENGGVILSDDVGRVIAMSPRFGLHPLLTPMNDIELELVQVVNRAHQGQKDSDGIRLVEYENDKVMVHHMSWQTGGRHMNIAAVAPVDDFVSHIRAMQKQILGFALLGLFLFVAIALYFSSRMSESVANLASDADRVRRFDFSGAPPRTSRIVEFHKLGKAFSRMKKDLSTHTTALEVAEKKLNRLVGLGIAMSAERNSEKLMEMVLLGAKELTNADGGSLYILGDDDQLHFQLVHNDTLDIAHGGTSPHSVEMPSVPLFDETGEPNHRNVVSYCVHKAKTVNTPDAYDHVAFDFSGTRAFDKQNNYKSQSFLTVPLRPRGGDVIGALQLINAREPGQDNPVPFSAEIQDFVEALAAQAATALYNRNLLDAQEKLMDAMIKLIAGAIDAKSPYTGGHCARVPELAIMLAENACEIDEGPLADFRFETDEQWREFRVGAWLHDSGKVVTPEYVVDKATKLEAIYNRIHEVRMRFEVLFRDAEIERLEALAQGVNAEETQAAFERRKAELLDDFAFIADSNVGGEYMAPEAIERLKSIAQTTWLRHFDDRLGLSHGELKRFDEAPAELPVVEKLLADKPGHVIARESAVHEMYENLGFKLKVPDNLYNHGEIYNLSIGRGTLTEEERFKINEHIMQTIAMLEHLPFPKHLARVPEYAGTHHETLDGTGYPRKLSKDDLSIPARIMAIADIFEALTASDRPYKKPKTLSESVKILSFFKKDGHIDPDLYDLFLTSGVYREYAERFLTPEQIDDVDIEPYLGA